MVEPQFFSFSFHRGIREKIERLRFEVDIRKVPLVEGSAERRGKEGYIQKVVQVQVQVQDDDDDNNA